MSEQAIHKALNKAMEEICRIGIGKTQKNEQQNYRFRGIEAAMNELAPVLVRNGITVTAAYSDLQLIERAKGEGKATRFVILKGRFTFSAEDGSSVISEVYGESMDAGDKAVVKAQSVAFRTALFQQFVVPTVAMDPESDEYDAPSDEPDGLDEARDQAMNGIAPLEKWWKSQDAKTRTRLGPHLAALKEAASKADQEKASQGTRQ